ncbi:phosphoglucosamine mutase [Anaerophaga thermohalophila]|uniref:phosphoglucosamine mutase n=1 Tax=Anaerophaga thermohalophila TaxID=177400 RepID=UPI0002FC578B|nr:phosphoglucosamine mutase [Anaerophaga thermohalophila]
MTLIKSISGIRGTIGGRPGEGLSPIDVVRFTSAYGTWLKDQSNKSRYRVVLGRDARISGPMVRRLVAGTLQGMGIDVVDLGLATTPTTELAVIKENADGGIILTASHNPKQWNALKLLNSSGEFLSASDGEKILSIADSEAFRYALVDELGKLENKDYTDIHIQDVLKLELVDVEAIRSAGFKVVIDCVNSVGGIALPPLLKALGVDDVVELNCEPNGEFPHNPEPLPEHLTEISGAMKTENADVGFVVDPDVDRLAIINEDGTMFGEEYTLVAVSDYVLSHNPGNTVSNLSSTRALKDVTERRGGTYSASAVGEVNVVSKMKQTNAVIGGEGNGGVIYPASHYGRDALVGIALFLTLLAKKGKKPSELRKEYPAYFMTKNKLELPKEINVDELLQKVKDYYSDEKVNDEDGVKIDFPEAWVHLRKSNTEPIVRVYSEAGSPEEAKELAQSMMNVMKSFI